MSNPLIADVEAYPEMFDLRLPVSPGEIDNLEADLGAALPPAFVEVLETLGQGTFFDNEILLGAHETDEGLGELVRVNRELRAQQGLSPELVVFHLGTGGLHAFDTSTPGPEYAVVTLDEDTLERGDAFATFADWYVLRVREAYREVLGLD